MFFVYHFFGYSEYSKGYFTKAILLRPFCDHALTTSDQQGVVPK